MPCMERHMPINNWLRGLLRTVVYSHTPLGISRIFQIGIHLIKI